MAAGEPVERNRRLFGAAVNLAARACSTARPREILVTSAVKDLASGKPFTFGDRGAVDLKGFERPIPLFTVRWTDRSD
jgi:class 3 adenylate cyclase